MPHHEEAIYENSFPVEGGNFDNAGSVSSQVKALLKRLKIPKEIVRRVALVTYESEINIVSYANQGKIVLRVTQEQVVIEAIDEGQGIADISLAMQKGYSTATDKIREMGFGAGMGLFNIDNFSDSFHITSILGEGTHLTMVIKHTMEGQEL
ncbi:MAG: ATP-binding protein [Syntrophales bacterium]|nr:ATP-binding protein [Syntrophales bacterium]